MPKPLTRHERATVARAARVAASYFKIRPGDYVLTQETIKLRLREAWDTLRRVPAHGVPGFKSNWPDVVHSVAEAYGWERASYRLEPASPQAIDRMHQTFTWFAFVADREKTFAVWLTCGAGMGPRRAGSIMGVSRWTAARWRDEALNQIATGLRKSQTDSCNRTSSNATARAS